MNPLVLIAEDEAEIAHILHAYLERDGLRTVIAADGLMALDLHRSLRPDIVLLDLKMPCVDGYEVLTELRRRGGTPVIVVSALADRLDKLHALRIGADDYVVKPFDAQEVVGRVRAVLRRACRARASVLQVRELEIDLISHSVAVASEASSLRSQLDLTLTEFRILAYMAHFPTRAFTRAELVDACLPGGDALERTIDSHAGKLRRKLKLAGAHGYFASVRGVGYRLVQLL
jgi:two-component system response regulator AdeR